MGRILLCADSESLIRPWMIGLEDVDLQDYPWLDAISHAEEMRYRISSGCEYDEIWVFSSDEIDAINLAAAIKKDRPDTFISVILPTTTGSVLSRAKAAEINRVLTSAEFALRFDAEVSRRNRIVEASTSESLNMGSVISGFVGNPDSASNGNLTIVPKQPEPIAEIPRSAKPSDTHRSFVLSVISGSGGSGKSIVAALISLQAAMSGRKTLLIDCDLQFGDEAYLLGERDSLNVDSAIGDLTTVERLADSHESETPYLISSPPRLESSEILNNHIGVLVEEGAKFFDVVILNTGSSWGEGHAAVLERSDCALFLIDQRASSIYSCKHALGLCNRLGFAESNFIFALNRCSKDSLFTTIDVACALQGFHIFELKEGGNEVEELAGAGCVSELFDSKNPLTVSVKNLLSEALPDLSQPAKGKRRHSKHVDDTSSIERRELQADPIKQRRFFNRKDKSSRRRSRKKMDLQQMRHVDHWGREQIYYDENDPMLVGKR